MKKHLKKELIHDYVAGNLLESDIKFVEHHMENCQECLEVAETFADLLADPEFETHEATRISDETTSYIVKHIEPFFNKPSIFQQLFDNILNLFKTPVRSQVVFATRKSEAQSNYLIYNSWFPKTEEILKTFGDVQILITFRFMPDYIFFKRKDSSPFSVTVKQCLSLEKDLRVTIRSGDFYEISELICKKKTCHEDNIPETCHEDNIPETCCFDNIPFAPYCMTFEYQAETKGKIFFSVLEKAIYIHPEDKQENNYYEQRHAYCS
jgi:hypothetical protein